MYKNMITVSLRFFTSLLVILSLGSFHEIWAMNDEVFEITGLKYSDPHWNELNYAKKPIDYDDLEKKYPHPGDAGITKAIINNDIKQIKKFFVPEGTIRIDQPSLLEGVTYRAGLKFYYPLEYALHWKASEEVLIELVKLGAPIKNYKGYKPQLAPNLLAKLETYSPAATSHVLAQPQQPQSSQPPLVTQQPTSPTIALTGPQPRISWADTVSRWCKEPRSRITKTGVCLVSLAAVAVATKLLYNSFLAKKTEAPSQITIVNDSGATITIGYKTKTSNDLTTKTLQQNERWSIDMNQIKLDLIITELETVRKPLALELGKYKASKHQQDTQLFITIYRASALRTLFSGIPYTYTAEWR